MARYQSNRASCGPAALSNALSAIGIERTEDELITLSGQNTNGTGVKGMLKALNSIASGEEESRAIKYRSAGDAITGLWYYVSSVGRPFILCVDDLEHWVVCTGHIGTRFCIIDSADTKLVLYYSGPDLAQRWGTPSGQEKRQYHGIVV